MWRQGCESEGVEARRVTAKGERQGVHSIYLKGGFVEWDPRRKPPVRRPHRVADVIVVAAAESDFAACVRAALPHLSYQAMLVLGSHAAAVLGMV